MLHTIKNEYLTVTAAEKGAELQSILGADGTEYLWQGDPAYWTGRAYNIFPFVARLAGGRYSMDGETHEMAIHGIARYRSFRAAGNTGTRLVLELASDGETREIYPRNFVFRVIYELRGRDLVTTYEAENRDARDMYFGLGGHPGFNVPLKAGLRFEDYRLTFAEPCRPERVGFTPDCFVSGGAEPYPLVEDRYLPLSHGLFDDDAVVLRGACRQVTVESPLDSHSVTVSFPQMPYVGFWHKPGTDAPYVCVEPWLSLPGNAGELTVFEERRDLVRLAPGQVYRNVWTVSVK